MDLSIRPADLTNAIFDFLDDGATTLVFPTENTARHYLSAYVRSRRRSVLADRAMAFDTFRAFFLPRHDDLRPSNKYYRLAFVTNFLDTQKTSLRYLYKDSLYDYRLRFVQFLTKILPDLGETERSVIESNSIRRDIAVLKSAYSAFLQGNGLFEPGWERCSLENNPQLSGRYVLVGSDSDIQMQMLLKDLGPSPNIDTLNKKEPGEAKYLKFLTEEAEIESLFQKLEELKQSGVPMQDILISTPQMDALRPRLERRGREYNIPLSFMRSLLLADTVPGRYLFAVRRCISENLSFRSMENLLLNTSLPFCDMEANRLIIRTMTDSNIQGGNLEFSDDSLFRELRRLAQGSEDHVRSRAFELYRNMKSAITAIRRAHDGDELIKDIHGLTTLLFGNDEFSSSDPSDRDVYSFMFSELAQITKAVKQTGLAIRDLFSVFMGEVENLSYVAQDKRTGIKVYTYGQDALINVPWHFVVGINDGNSLVQKKCLAFLEDHEVRVRESYDVTDSMILCYTSSGDNVWISGSEVSYSGAQSTPTFFILNNAVEEMRSPSFRFYFEKADASSLETAEKTFMGDRGPDYAVDGGGPVIDLSGVRLSYTSISNYARCPYRTYLQSDLTKDVPDDFEPSKQDDKKIGSFLHEVVQAFMALHFGQVLSQEHLEQYYAELEDQMDKALEKSRDFDDLTKLCIKGKYMKALRSILDIMLKPSRKTGAIGPFMPLKNEYLLDSDSSFTGRVDTIIQDTSGNIFLLDYKKGGGDATYQLVLYKRLYDKRPPYGDSVRACYFYSMRDSQFKGIQDAKLKAQEDKLDHDIESLRTGYSAGDWKATPSKDSCERCEERSICRRRFNLQ
ncbi:MAG: PD-(D/E)XK nuclease family protein [Sphaerochaetaceae bacterium]|nr:PD-(D/E)XK nuclease family protein [Sphaerochaetaceae bacterium]